MRWALGALLPAGYAARTDEPARPARKWAPCPSARRAGREVLLGLVPPEGEGGEGGVGGEVGGHALDHDGHDAAPQRVEQVGDVAAAAAPARRHVDRHRRLLAAHRDERVHAEHLVLGMGGALDAGDGGVRRDGREEDPLVAGGHPGRGDGAGHTCRARPRGRGGPRGDGRTRRRREQPLPAPSWMCYRGTAWVEAPVSTNERAAVDATALSFCVVCRRPILPATLCRRSGIHRSSPPFCAQRGYEDSAPGSTSPIRRHMRRQHAMACSGTSVVPQRSWRSARVFAAWQSVQRQATFSGPLPARTPWTWSRCVPGCATVDAGLWVGVEPPALGPQAVFLAGLVGRATARPGAVGVLAQVRVAEQAPHEVAAVAAQRDGEAGLADV